MGKTALLRGLFFCGNVKTRQNGQSFGGFLDY